MFFEQPHTRGVVGHWAPDWPAMAMAMTELLALVATASGNEDVPSQIALSHSVDCTIIVRREFFVSSFSRAFAKPGVG